MGIGKIHTLSSPISSLQVNLQAGARGISARESADMRARGEEQGWIADSSPSQPDFVKLQKINENLNAIAEAQRDFEKRFEKINDYVEQMKDRLGTIIKQFPPFPPGSEERVRALRGYVYFRKLFDELTLSSPKEILIGPMEELARISEAPESDEKAAATQSPASDQPVALPVPS